MDRTPSVLQQAPETVCSKDKAMKLLREAFQLIISDGVDLRREPEVYCNSEMRKQHVLTIILVLRNCSSTM
jgi:hypothetical protein